MKKSLIKRIVYVFACVVLLCFATGCSFIPELSLTEEQNELVAEYAAGLLVKYQIGHSMGITPLYAYDFIEEPKVQPETADDGAEEVANDSEVPEGEMSDDENPVQDNVADESAETVSSSVPMADVFGAQGFTVTPTGYEIAKVYPGQQGDELVFSMQATPGNELLVIHFEVANVGESEAECNLMVGGVKARAIIDKGSRVPAQATILDNDLLNMNVTLEAYSTTDGVLVFEVPEGSSEAMTSLDLVLSGAEGENLYRLI